MFTATSSLLYFPCTSKSLMEEPWDEDFSPHRNYSPTNQCPASRTHLTINHHDKEIPHSAVSWQCKRMIDKSP